MKVIGFYVESLLHNKSWSHKSCSVRIHGASLGENTWRLIQFYLKQWKLRYPRVMHVIACTWSSALTVAQLKGTYNRKYPA